MFKEGELDIMFLSYGVNPYVLKGLGREGIKTEAFTDILNGLGDIEENIMQIENVFIHYAR
jgi:hypothetical protein